MENQIYADPAGTTTPKRPILKPVEFDKIPESLHTYLHFVMWKYVLNKTSDKWTKPPKTIFGGAASTNKDETHCTFSDAKTAYNSGKYSGIGLVFRDGLCGIDLDHCIDEDGVVEPWANEILEKFSGTYQEKSPGGDGFHILCNGVILKSGKYGPQKRLEQYDTSSPRYFTLTGHSSGSREITDQQVALDWLAAQYGKNEKPPAKQKFEIPVLSRLVASSPEVTDRKIISQISKSPQSAGLWSGAGGHASASESDLALCNQIAYWTTDKDQIDRIFRQSGLFREKWDEMRGGETYGEITIKAAVSGTSAQKGIDARYAYKNKQIVSQQIYAKSTQPGTNNPISFIEPLQSPESIFHPKHITWKKDKVTQEVFFDSAMGTTENLERLLNAYKISVKYNEMSKEVEISYNGKLNGDLEKSASLIQIENIATINKFPPRRVIELLDSIASKNAYHPAIEWIKSKPWDGSSRVPELFKCLTLKDESKRQISAILFQRWVIGAVAILTRKATNFEHVLILVDQQGGTGKTRFFESVSPVDFHATGVTLDLRDKDTKIKAIKRWLIELGELDSTFKKSDIAELKGFLSMSEDSIRLPYGRTQCDFERRTAFFGTVNDVKFLVDDTNNRRFWPIEITSVNFKHGIDMQQFWAEVLTKVEEGHKWFLTPDENQMIGDHNDSHRFVCRIEESILTAYSLTESRNRKLTATQILKELGFENPSISETKKAGVVLRKHFLSSISHKVTVYNIPSKTLG